MPQRFQDCAVFEKGEDVVFKIPFTGNPKPKVSTFPKFCLYVYADQRLFTKVNEMYL